MAFKYISVLILSLLFIPKPEKNSNDEAFEDFKFIRLSVNKFVSNCEISNAQYQKFLDEHGDLIHTQINSEGWETGEEFQKSYFQPIKLLYGVDKKYKDHPVVNIRQEGANAYCDWLTNSYNQNPLGKYSKVKFRLPSIKEYKVLYDEYSHLPSEEERLGFNEPFVTEATKKARENIDIDFENPNEEDFWSSQYVEFLRSDKFVSTFTTWPVTLFPKKEPKINHLFGNVSEWTLTKDIASGGHWLTKQESEITDTLQCNSFSPKIGFRIVMEVIEK